MNRNSFSCTHCGKCCQHLTLVDSKDIARISQHGHHDFTTHNPFTASDTKEYLLQKGTDCIFLAWKEGKSSCLIYPYQPASCRAYPFFGKKSIALTCMPKDVLCGKLRSHLR